MLLRSETRAPGGIQRSGWFEYDTNNTALMATPQQQYRNASLLSLNFAHKTIACVAQLCQVPCCKAAGCHFRLTTLKGELLLQHLVLLPNAFNRFPVHACTPSLLSLCFHQPHQYKQNHIPYHTYASSAVRPLTRWRAQSCQCVVCCDSSTAMDRLPW